MPPVRCVCGRLPAEQAPRVPQSHHAPRNASRGHTAARSPDKSNYPSPTTNPPSGPSEAEEQHRMPLRPAAALAAYILAILAANTATDHYGLAPMGFGFTATAGTYAAGLALLLRDAVQDYAGTRWVFAGIAAGVMLTALTAPSLAVASAAAFLLAELLDMAVYTPLREHGWARAALASGIAGATMDTLAFLALAGFPLTAQTIGGQLVGKALWATAAPVAVVLIVRQVRLAVPRHSVGS